VVQPDGPLDPRRGGPGHLLHNAYGYGLFTGGLGAHYGAEKLGCTMIPVSGGMTERQVTLIRDLRGPAPRCMSAATGQDDSTCEERRDGNGADP
jgi:hypothetical protein